MTKRHYDALKRLQVVAYKSFPELKKIALANVGSIDSREGLTKALAPLSDARLAELASTLGFIGAKSCPEANTRKFIEEVMVVAYERRTSQIDALNNRSLYPDEVGAALFLFGGTEHANDKFYSDYHMG
jgi:intron-binding protein aquarius